MLTEEALFFRQFNFHRQKLILHRASMKAYEQELKEKGYSVEYIATADPRNHIVELINSLAGKGVQKIHCCNPSDYLLSRRIQRAARQNNIQLHQVQGPDFLTDQEDAAAFFSGKEHYHQTDFYIRQRKQLQILIDQQQKPIGGKWSMDAENRKKVPKDYKASYAYSLLTKGLGEDKDFWQGDLESLEERTKLLEQMLPPAETIKGQQEATILRNLVIERKSKQQEEFEKWYMVHKSFDEWCTQNIGKDFHSAWREKWKEKTKGKEYLEPLEKK